MIPVLFFHLITCLVFSFSLRCDAMKLSLHLARQAAHKGDLAEALFHYCIVLKTVGNVQDRQDDFADEFGEVLSGHLANCLDLEESSKLWATAVELFPRCPSVFNILGHDAFSKDILHQAYQFFARAVEFSSGFERVISRMNLCNMKTNLVDTWHFAMINDKVRNSRFEEAILLAVKPNDLVLDIGTGTGILAMVAARVAKNVVACEENLTMYQVSTVILETNEVGPKVVPVDQSSQDIRLKNKADLIISETLDCCVFGENIVSCFLDCHLRNAAPRATFIPSAATVRIALLESKTMFEHHAFNLRNRMLRSEFVASGDFDLQENEPYWCCYLQDFPDSVMLSDWFDLISVNFYEQQDLEDCLAQKKQGEVVLKAALQGTLHVIVASFSAQLFGPVTIDSREGTCWQHGIYPVVCPISVEPGTEVSVAWRLGGARANRLEVRVVTGQQEHLCEPTNLGQLPSGPDLYCQNDAQAVEHLVSLLPSSAGYVHDLTGLLMFTERLVLRDSLTVAVCQPNQDMLRLCLDHAIFDGKVDMMIAPIAGFAADTIVHWPIRGDGTLSQQMMDFVATARTYCPTARVIPREAVMTATLFTSDWLNERSRLVPSSHLGFDLAPLASFSLFEYRDISPKNFPHSPLSDEFDLLPLSFEAELDLSQRCDPKFKNRTMISRVPVTGCGASDGVVYWFRVDGHSTAQRVLAAFLFQDRIEVCEGDTVEVRADFYNGEILVEGKRVD